jgi:hypothetical protein
LELQCTSSQSKKHARIGIGDLKTDPSDPNTRKTDDDGEKAEILASFFSSVFTQEPDGQLPEFRDRSIMESMEELYITTEDIMSLKKLKVDKPPEMDKIHPRFLKETYELPASLYHRYLGYG